MKDENLQGMTTKEKQVFAAKCFSKYCEEKGIVHPSIDALIEHLMSIATFENIVDGERKGAQLELAGRGDEIPKSLDSILALEDKSFFIELVDCVVEVGIVDMYGAATAESTFFLKKCIALLEQNKVTLPTI